mmetsp:Transcript_90473/g.255810  ORF Transcript_90473/g.255810 Transcript_90473/m.255810 type:complete len:331 (+) Transcript_90473:78-1070(+)
MVSKLAFGLACVSFASALSGQQVQEAERSVAGARSTACDCLEFAGVYYDNLAACGRAHELYFATKYGASAAYAPTEPIAGLPHQVCNNFFKNFKNNSCVNVDLLATSTADDNLHPANSFPADPLAASQWCYVSNDCDTLNGGDYATNIMGFQLGGWNNLASTSNLSWKICDPVADASYMLKYKTVQELIDIGTESDVGLSRLIRLAYPVVAITWAEVSFKMQAINDAWTTGADLATLVDSLPVPPASFTRAAEVHTTISDIIKSGQATILDTPGHGDNFHVIKGREAWSVTRNALGNMIYLSGHFSMEFDVTCLMGCATTRVEALDLETQ